MYLSANTRPDIAYAVHQAARFSHAPRNSHAVAVRHILQYLHKTKTMGITLKPTSDQCVDCYVDADFAGLFAIENNEDPISVKSRTGYVILYKGSPLLWVSKMQTQIALSTMEAEYIALSQAMHDLIPIREILKEFMHIVFNITPSIQYHTHSKAFTDVSKGTTKNCIEQSTIYEDNQACLKFARMPKLSPRTKHIGIPYHWFRSKITNLEIQVEPIDSNSQLADQFTKGLCKVKFQAARLCLMGWSQRLFLVERESNGSIVKYAGWHIDQPDSYLTVESGTMDMSELNLVLIKSNISSSFLDFPHNF